MEIIISMDEHGKFSVDISEGLPLFMAIGALEVAKNMIVTGDLNPDMEPAPQVVDDEEGLQ